MKLKDQLLLEAMRTLKNNLILVLILKTGETNNREYPMLDFDEHDAMIWISSNFDENLKHLDEDTSIVGWYIMDTLETQGEPDE